MDAFVGKFVSYADGLISNVAQSGFGAVLQAVNGIAASCAILAICFLVLNQFLQIQHISLSKFLALFIKLILISVIGLKWSNFSAVATAVQTGMDTIGAKLLTMAAPTSSTTVAGAIDNIINVLSEKANEVSSRASWMGGAIMAVVVTLFLSILGCVGALIIVYSKVMFAVFLCIAPIFIACYIFETTKDYFYRWLQGAITYTLYPVLTAAVIGMTYSVMMAYINGANGVVETIASFVPFLAVAIMMILIIAFIPVIVSGLSGMIQNVSPAAMFVQGSKAYNHYKETRGSTKGGLSDFAPKPPQTPAQPQPAAQSAGSFQGSAGRMQARANRINGNK